MMSKQITIIEDKEELARVEAVQKEMEAKNRSGCWAVLYEHEGYHGRELRVNGPVEISNLVHASGNWHDKADSIVVGPNAVCRLYHRANYGGGHITFLPSERHTDLGHVGYHDAASALKLYAADDLNPPY